MHFTNLCLHGFKSFVEKTELPIDAGLTGIVGPNGCGKSNLVEALKWVMGETSAKRMRGADMDDVIFAGTTTRPSRNIAEVSLKLDNTNRSASTEFNNADELLVLRKIERNSGSDYRINGKPVRQRDVQLLFADQSTGAHSGSVVGQGQIDALIRAKPQERRQILEEASGTAGLQARRHEAELKLKGAEQNLTRVDDVLNTLDAQLRSLKTQVRQASRYRNLAEHIRKTEAALLHLKWAEAEGNAEKCRNQLAECETMVNDLLAEVTASTTIRTELASTLPGLRHAETAAAVIVQKLTLAREQIDSESNRIKTEINAQKQRLNEAKTDCERETVRHRDGTAAIERLTAEEQTLVLRATEYEAALPGIAEQLAAKSQQVETMDVALAALLESVAKAEAHRHALEKEVSELNNRLVNLKDKKASLERQRDTLTAELAGKPDISLATALVDASENELARRQTEAQNAEEARAIAEQAQNECRTNGQALQSVVMKFRAEKEAISSLLQADGKAEDEIINLVQVTPGFELALAVALGEALTASLQEKDSKHWRELPEYEKQQPLPAGVESLGNHIKSPPALTRSLSQIGVVEDAVRGQALSHQLLPGQILVSRDGWAWRWDGFTTKPEAKTATAVRLQQKNRLAEIQTQLIAAEQEYQSAEGKLQEAIKANSAAQTADQTARQALKAAFNALNDARQLHAQQEREATNAGAKMATLTASLQQTQTEIEELEAKYSRTVADKEHMPQTDSLRTEINAQRAALAESRGEQARFHSENLRLKREKQLCDERKAVIKKELEDWKNRITNAATQTETLQSRITDLETSLQALENKPDEFNSRRAALLTELSEAENTRKIAADALIEAERSLTSAEHHLKEREEKLGTAREDRVRAESALQAAYEFFNTLRERAAEKLNCNPQQLAELAGFAEDEAWPALHELEQSLARYMRERENMGPVNLRAEVEQETVQADIDRLTQEKEDLTAAIAKLRQGIGQLNKEAKERLQAAFSLVNERFQKLFMSLFNGGKAHLELVNGEDPMNAGLEIFAAPPGKKVQILSLLSGGERTLTALALLFAVFQTNPSPICVLDEAEAALDESNIDRFCTLVENISRETGTRFLIITHQRLTMARMDRLFGVTMAEKGVSQLVSVDLARAVAIRDGEDKATSASSAESAAAALKDVQAA